MFSRMNPGRLCELAVVAAGAYEGVPETEVAPRRREYAKHIGAPLGPDRPTQNSDRPVHIRWAVLNPKHKPNERINLGSALASFRDGRYFLTWPSSRTHRATSRGNIPASTIHDTQSGSSAHVLSAMEGMAREQRVLAKGRNGRLRKEALRLANGTCSVCEKDFSQVLGGRGIRVLQVHHKEQIALSREPRVTRLEDLAVVCANCHALIHLDIRSAFDIEELQAMLGASRTEP